MAEMDMGLSPNNGKKKKKKKKQSLGKSIVTGLFPCKGDSTVEAARKLVFLIALIVLASALIMIAARVLQYVKEEAKARDPSKGPGTAEEYIYDLKNKTPTKNEIAQLPEGTINEKYATLYAENKDFIGWLEIPGANIDEAVVQTENNDDYLHTNFQGEYDFSGTLFVDYESKILPDKMPQNTIIYGHNMAYKFKFSALHNYKTNIDFLKISPVIKFDTLYHNNQYKIISVFVTNISPDHGEVFNYTSRVKFTTRDEFYSFVLECLDRSIYNMGVDIEYGDEFLTLSTCDRSTGLDLRLVIVARRVRDNESIDVDPDQISWKDSVKYFETYENIFGRQWFGRTWDTSLVKGIDDYIKENGLEDDPEDYR